MRELPQQAAKLFQESKSAAKTQQHLLAELAELYAQRLLAEASQTPRIIVRVYHDRDSAFIKLLAQKLTAGGTDVITLLASGSGQPALVFAQSPGQKFNMGQLMKEAMGKLAGRGGGTNDMAQGGLPAGSAELNGLEKTLHQIATTLQDRSNVD